MIKIRPIQTDEQVQRLLAAAKEDEHGVVSASHLVIKDGEIVGYVGSVPALTVWMHTKKVQVRDSIQVIQFAENFLAAGGASVVGIPCSVKSPLLPYLQKDADVIDTGCTLFLKDLKKGF